MKKSMQLRVCLILLLATILGGCVTYHEQWVIKDRQKFDADYEVCSRQTYGFAEQVQLRTMCMVRKGYDIGIVQD